MGLDWRCKEVVFRLRLGGRRDRGVRYPRGAVLETHFSKLGTDPDATGIPLEALGADVDVFVVRSHPVAAPLPTLALRPRGWLRYVSSRYHHHFIELAGSFEAYLDRFSAKTRATLRRKVKRFAALSGGALDVAEYRRPEEMDAFFREARAVSARSYQERLLGCGLPDDDHFRAELRQWAAQDGVRGYVLRHAGAPAAYLCCPVRDGVVFYEHVGYDPALRQHSPGTVLFHAALERLFAERHHRLFDFTEGDGPHKEQFATGSVPCADLWYFRWNARNAAVVTSFAAVRGAAAQAAALLRRLRERRPARPEPAPEAA